MKDKMHQKKFDYSQDICDFVNDPYNSVKEVVTICAYSVDGIPRFLLFYTKTE